ncbi:hypothetical protein ACFPMF_02075 [Larkinella bovis]|uniref:LPXTG cell wall anchor domain-containing protein n=1 Tax=Larkinella bovis TaxID=683041 RepID=A0ABW0I660_9BACT
MNRFVQVDTVSGDYYGVVYKGPFFPILLLVLSVVAVTVWWFLRKRAAKK